MKKEEEHKGAARKKESKPKEVIRIINLIGDDDGDDAGTMRFPSKTTEDVKELVELPSVIPMSLRRRRVKGEIEEESRQFLIMEDVAKGSEPVALSDEKIPSDFEYITENRINPPLKRQRGDGCSCEGDCGSNPDCECRMRYEAKVVFPTFPCKRPRVLVNGVQNIFECHEGCNCSERCINRVTRGLHYKLEIYRTKFKGWALRTLEDIEQGSFVLEYIGEVRRANDENEFTYLFKIGEHVEIDPKHRGNVARFLNHSCTPNLHGK
eukprot:jgi/Bigna1/80755/fgenesh1_pg.74_\